MAVIFGPHGTGEAANRKQAVTPLRWRRRLPCPGENALGTDGLIALSLGEGGEVAQQTILDSVLEAQGAVQIHVSADVLHQHGTPPGQGCAMGRSMAMSTLA